MAAIFSGHDMASSYFSPDQGYSIEYHAQQSG